MGVLFASADLELERGAAVLLHLADDGTALADQVAHDLTRIDKIPHNISTALLKQNSRRLNCT